MPLWIIVLGEGLALGLVGAGVKHILLKRALKRTDTVPPEKANKTLLSCYLYRYLINMLFLLLAFFLLDGNVPFLIGTALGLTAFKYKFMFEGLTDSQVKK